VTSVERSEQRIEQNRDKRIVKDSCALAGKAADAIENLQTEKSARRRKKRKKKKETDVGWVRAPLFFLDGEKSPF
jgi:hypothetical protein